MYVGNLPFAHCARPSAIGQRLVSIMAYIYQKEGISNFKEMQGQYCRKNYILSNIISYNNIVIDTSSKCQNYVTDLPRYTARTDHEVCGLSQSETLPRS